MFSGNIDVSGDDVSGDDASCDDVSGNIDVSGDDVSGNIGVNGVDASGNIDVSGNNVNWWKYLRCGSEAVPLTSLRTLRVSGKERESGVVSESCECDCPWKGREGKDGRKDG